MTATVAPAATPAAALAQVTCLGSSQYVAHSPEDVSQRNKKGRATYAIVDCPTCHTTLEAGVWFTDSKVSPDAPLRGDEGLTYLPRHAAPVLGPLPAPVDEA